MTVVNLEIIEVATEVIGAPKSKKCGGVKRGGVGMVGIVFLTSTNFRNMISLAFTSCFW
jgi:hypothetical protein